MIILILNNVKVKIILNLNKNFQYNQYNNLIKIKLLIIINVKIIKEYNIIQFICNNKIMNNIRIR